MIRAANDRPRAFLRYLAHKTARGEHTYFLSHGTQTQGQITVELAFHPEGGGGAAAAYDEAGHPDDLFNKVMRTLGAQYAIVGEWAAGQGADADCSPGPGLCDAYGQATPAASHGAAAHLPRSTQPLACSASHRLNRGGAARLCRGRGSPPGRLSAARLERFSFV